MRPNWRIYACTCLTVHVHVHTCHIRAVPCRQGMMLVTRLAGTEGTLFSGAEAIDASCYRDSFPTPPPFPYPPPPSPPPSPPPAASGPGWTVNAASFENSMSLTSIVSLPRSGYATTGTLAAFVGSDAVRGVAQSPIPLQFGPYAGTYIFQMLIYANVAGETVTFKFWDGAIEYECPETLTFASDASLGTAFAPQIFTTAVTLTIPLAVGWTWLSINVVPTSSTLNDALGSISPRLAEGDTMKSIDQFSTYYTGYGWVRPVGDERYVVHACTYTILFSSCQANHCPHHADMEIPAPMPTPEHHDMHPCRAHDLAVWILDSAHADLHVQD